jgi:cobalt-zinc-cadmium efflux system outer membrane protein
LRIAQHVAGHEIELAESRAAAQTGRVLNAVRALFYETLAAEQTQRITAELAKLAEQGVSVAQQRERAGEGTLAEVLQAQIELEQVRILASNAENNYHAAWQRLAAQVGRPEMPQATLAGSLDESQAELDRMASLRRIEAESPELRSAGAGIRRAEAALARARVEPIPNWLVESAAQYDFASEDMIASLGVSFPLPIWNRNQGNILSAESELQRSRHELDRVRLSLAERFAVAFARYRNARQQVQRYGRRLPDSAVRGILSLRRDQRQTSLDAHPEIVPRAQLALALATEGWQRGEFNYLHVLTAQRTLAQVSLSYVRSLAELRQSIVALDGLLLTDGVAGAAEQTAEP